MHGAVSKSFSPYRTCTVYVTRTLLVPWLSKVRVHLADTGLLNFAVAKAISLLVWGANRDSPGRDQV